MNPVTLDELLTQLQDMREQLGRKALVVVGERGFELACSVEAVSWPDIEDCELVHLAIRICGA